MGSSLLLRNRRGQDLNTLYQFVLLIVLTGMVIGVGILTLDKIGSATFYSRTANDSSFSVNNESGSFLSWGNITTLKVVNRTSSISDLISSSCYTVDTTTGNFTWVGNTTALCNSTAGALFDIIYGYKDFATATRDATAAAGAEVGNIATDWIGLIVTIFILAIILGLVIRSFRPGMDRG